MYICHVKFAEKCKHATKHYEELWQTEKLQDNEASPKQSSWVSLAKWHSKSQILPLKTSI